MYKKIKLFIYTLLVKSQKWTKTDMVYLFREGFWLNFGQLLMIITNLCLTLVFANYLNPEVYGTYKFVISFISVLSLAALPGMNTAITRSVAQGHDGILIPALREKLRWSVLSSIVSFFIAVYYFIQGNHNLSLSFFLLTIFVPIVSSFDKVSINYLNGKKQFKKLSKYQVIANAINVFAVIFTLLITKNIFYILLVYLLSLAIVRVAMFYFIIKQYKIPKNDDNDSLIYGKHLTLMNIIGTISGTIDKILIFHFIGPVELAIYTFAQTPIKYLKSPLSTFSQLALPKLSQRNLNTLKKTIPQKVVKMFILIVPVVIIYILTIPVFFKLFLPKYTDAILYSQVLSLLLLFYPMSLMTQSLTAHAKKKQLYILQTIIPALKIILFFILLPLYGIWGVIATLIFAELTSLIVVVFFFKYR